MDGTRSRGSGVVKDTAFEAGGGSLDDVEGRGTSSRLGAYTGTRKVKIACLLGRTPDASQFGCPI